MNFSELYAAVTNLDADIQSPVMAINKENGKLMDITSIRVENLQRDWRVDKTIWIEVEDY